MAKKSVTDGFRWCPHCGKPHGLAERACATTGRTLDSVLHRPTTQNPFRPIPPPPAHVLVGSVLDGKYRILRQLGSGGMGVVFEAEHLVLRRLVAIKVVARPGSPEALQRLALEAQIVAAIHHPNICDVYDIGRLTHGGPYIVLERLVGETLAVHMRLEHRPSIRMVIDIFAQALAGLHAAHCARIVHRDLKPQNLFLLPRMGFSPFVKVLDFGFAQDLAATRRLTKPGKACGTVPYMSPEQLRGDPLDHRSDLFAIGVIIYEMLTGRHPFEGTTQTEVMVNILRADPRRLRLRRPDVAPELESIIMGALSKERDRRPPTAQIMQALLSAAAERLPDSDEFEEEATTSANAPMWIPPSASPSS